MTDPGQCPAERSLTLIVVSLSGSFTVIGLKCYKNKFNTLNTKEIKKSEINNFKTTITRLKHFDL